MTEIIDIPINIDDFDYHYYLKNNNDLVKAKMNTLIQCYTHWINHGCYENRKVRSLKSGKEISLNLTNKQKLVKINKYLEKNINKNQSSFKDDFVKVDQSNVNSNINSNVKTEILNKNQLNSNVKQNINKSIQPKEIINLIKPFAILIHIYNTKYLSYFTKNIQLLYAKYTKESFDIFINIVYVSNKVEIINNENNTINQEINKLYKPHIIYSENKGGDIGGFLNLCKLLDLDKYNGVIFVHSKTKDKWRIDLCSSIFNYNFSNDEINFGLLGNSKWIHLVDPEKHELNYIRFSEHFIKLFKVYNFDDYLQLTLDKKYKNINKWEFVAGTMFIANIKIIKYIVDHDIDYVYSLLNKLESVDENWLRIIKEMKLDNKGCGNDLFYRVKYGRPLHADFMIEHAFERILGLICNKLNLTIKKDTYNSFDSYPSSSSFNYYNYKPFY
jgi:hypothetical protein